MRSCSRRLHSRFVSALAVALLLAGASDTWADALRLFPSFRATVPANHPLAPAIAALGSSDRTKAGRLVTEVLAKTPSLAAAHELRGFILAEEGDMVGAQAAFTKALTLSPQPRITHGALGEVLFLLGKYADARQMLATYLKIAPSDANANGVMGRLAVVTGDLRAAATYFEKLLPAVDARGQAAALNLVPVYLRLGEAENARARLAECTAACRLTPAYTLASALIASAEGRKPDAERQLTTLVAANTRIPEAWWELGALRRERGDLKGAEAAFTRLGGFDGWQPMANLNMATIRMHQGDTKRALVLLEPLVQQKTMPEAYALASQVLAATRENTRAEQTLRKLVTDFPTYGQGHLLLGLWQLSTQQTTPGRQSLEKAVSLQPDLIQGWIHLANLASVAHKPADAERLLRDGIKAAPNNPELYFHLGVSLEQRNQWSPAANAYAEALKRDPAHLGAANNRARMLARLGTNLDEAEKLMRAIHARDRTNPLILGNLGWVLVTRGNIKEGVPLLETAVAKQGDNPELHYYLSTAYAKQGRTREAGEQMRLAREQGLPADYPTAKP